MRAASHTGSTHLFYASIDPMLLACTPGRHPVPQDNYLQAAQRHIGQQLDQLFKNLCARRDQIDMA
jgi:hypothetical protein